jgi:methionine synthase II (cobalamin-independent)
MLESHPAMEVDPTVPLFSLRQWDGKLLRETPLLRFREGVDPDEVTFETGYATAARASYDVFRRLRAAGVIPAGVRFQVCLPTPMASAYMYVSGKAREAYIPAYERALMRALRDIVAAIPAHDLTIQWDVCQEVLIHEGFFPDRPEDYDSRIVAELARLGDAVPAGVETGYHLCYGSPGDEHLVMPRDTALMVEIANDVRRVTARRIDFLHVPVPKDRADADYFRPLGGLTGFDETTLYLGLIHHDDRAGDIARIEAARAFVRRFGVASECGWGRGDPGRVPGLLASHRAAIEFIRQEGLVP